MDFGFVFTTRGLVVYDVCRDDQGGQVTFIASLSQDPRVHFAGPTHEIALGRLLAYLGVANRLRA